MLKGWHRNKSFQMHQRVGRQNVLQNVNDRKKLP